MSVDAVLILLSLLSFVALFAAWISAPLSADAPHPVAVRFGWADYPVVNLWNGAGLPASPFKTDDFPWTTRRNK